MTAPPRKTVGSLLLVLLGALAGCTSYFEIPIETPIQPKLDITAFQRVLVAGFVAAGNEACDEDSLERRDIQLGLNRRFDRDFEVARAAGKCADERQQQATDRLSWPRGH